MDSPTNALDVREVEGFLSRRFGVDGGGLQPLQHGEWSHAFAFRRGGRDYVARFGAHVEDFAKDRLVANFAIPALPVPAVLEVGDAFGGFFAISERAFGAFLDDLDEAGMRRTLPALFAALDDARAAELSTSTGCGLWRADGLGASRSWREWLSAVGYDSPALRTHGWRARLASSPTGDGPFLAALDAMTALLPACPERRDLIHSDLLHYNVLVSADRVTGIFDWGCSLYGDFLYDVAWLSFWAPWYPAWRVIDFVAEARRHYAAIGLDVPRFEARLRCYELHIGLAGQAYNAYKGCWDELAATAQRTLTLARAPFLAST